MTLDLTLKRVRAILDEAHISDLEGLEFTSGKKSHVWKCIITYSGAREAVGEDVLIEEAFSKAADAVNCA